MRESVQSIVCGWITIPEIMLLNFYHYCWSLLGAIWYRFPSRGLTVVGVTGTNGKTTVVELTAHILRAAGIAVASSSSVQFAVMKKKERNSRKMTMPGRVFIQWFLRRAARAGATHAVLEVTSEGIRQSRHRFIQFAVVAMTNVTPEHIESHGGFAQYQAAKFAFFDTLKKGSPFTQYRIVNGDDPSAPLFFEHGEGARWVYGKTENTTGMPRDVLLRPSRAQITAEGVSFVLDGVTYHSPLRGAFNLSNILCALAIARALGVGSAVAQRAVAAFAGVSGRMEYVREGQYFDVVVDYAHTPDALAQVYQTLAGEQKSTRLICVLGSAGGGRDKWKRPELGKIARQYCSRVIVTNEDPYNEDPEAIINAVAVDGAFEKILDRREAISRAVGYASPGDTVVITGKGAEPVMAVADGKKIPWDDCKVVREVLRGLVENKER